MTPVSVSGDYAEAIQFLYSRINYEHTATIPCRGVVHLERMRRLLERLGNPQLQMPVVHIAGTKGKGSTAAMLGSVLTTAGYRTGVYTSPHLTCLEERYRVDGVRCTPGELVMLTDRLRPVVEEFDRSEAADAVPGLTFFEITTAMAWLYFLHRAVDLAVVDVGLGGRLDSTNVCQPLATVITSISFDHMKQLGSTLAAIAREKAGIIKERVPVISGVVAPEARGVIAEIAGEHQAPLISIGHDFDVSNIRLNRADSFARASVQFDFQQSLADRPSRLDRVQLGLLGRHQAVNGGVALAVLSTLAQLGWARLGESSIRQGLAAAQCPARIEVIRSAPIIILDTAHNVASAAALVDALQGHFAANQRVLVFAASRDKEIAGMLRLLLPHFSRVVLTQFLTNPRALPASKLGQIAEQVVDTFPPANGRPQLAVASSPRAAWEVAASQLQDNDLACVTGSFFLAAEMREFLAGSSSLSARAMP